ncbi:MAG TPA: DUF2726 domain-containing protein [Burkholderiaceae bacterium]|jgi:hypothetical protein|nr:DUF2726 domain-containing protein [Burkholderiaceae bacterium]
MFVPLWTIALVILACAAGALWLWRRPAPRPGVPPLPTEWALMARPVFTSDERRAYRQLREALPHHIILAKLPLVRLCQPLDAQQGRYWYDLLGAIHVSFAVCSPNGRVVAAVDLDGRRPTSRRAAAIKAAVLENCRVRHLKCSADQFPSHHELQLLVPQQGQVSRPAPLHSAPAFHEARATLAHTVRAKRAERTQRWSDSGFTHDSFFMPDSRYDTFANSDFSPMAISAAEEASRRTRSELAAVRSESRAFAG